MNNTKPYTKPVKFISGTEGERCNYPLRVDPYFGCEHNCCYCYAKAIQERWGNIEKFNANIRIADWNDIKYPFENILIKNKTTPADKYQYIKERIPVRIGANTDPLQPIEKTYKLTYKLIEFLNQNKYPYIIVTKSDLIATDDYINILDKNLAYIQISVTTLNDDLSSKIEPGAPLPRKRIAAIKKLSEKGFKVAARISPIIPMYEDGYFSTPSITHDIVCDFFSFDLIREICKAKPTTIISEFLRISKKINNSLTLLGVNTNKLFKGKNVSNYMNISLAEKIEYIKKIKEISDPLNIQFTICDDINYLELKKYWNNSYDCCNGCGNIKIFKTKYSLKNLSLESIKNEETIQKISTNKEVQLSFFKS